jgi:hypothetical protein
MCTALLLLYLGIKSEDGASFIFAATGAETMGFLGFAALGTE